MKHLFFGGIHPKYNKEMSTIITAFSTIAPKQVVIPMQQHIGAPCQPLVKVGDHVLFDRFGMNIVNLEGTDYIITRQRDILAIVEDK